MHFLLTLRREVASSIVEINVANEKTYYVHKSLLTKESKYFKAALEGDFREARENRVKLEEVDVKTFSIFVDWLYTSRLEVAEVKPNNLSRNPVVWDDDRDLEMRARIGQHMNLYIFGDAHDIPALRRSTVDSLFNCFNHFNTVLPTRKLITHAFAHLPRSSPLIQMLIDFSCRYEGVECDDDLREHEDAAVDELPIRYLAALYVRHQYIAAKLDAGEWDLDYDIVLCDYHEHTDDKERDDCPGKRRIN